MPKMKTHRGAAKRFKITGTGKILRRKAYRDHLLEHKPTRRTRRLGRAAEVTGGDRKRVKRMLGRESDGSGEAFSQRPEASSRDPRRGPGLHRGAPPPLPQGER